MDKLVDTIACNRQAASFEKRSWQAQARTILAGRLESRLWTLSQASPGVAGKAGTRTWRLQYGISQAQ